MEEHHHMKSILGAEIDREGKDCCEVLPQVKLVTFRNGIRDKYEHG